MASSFGSGARGGALKSPALAILLAALSVAATAEARRKKVPPPPPPPPAEHAPATEPGPPPPKSSPGVREAPLEPVTGPSLTVVGIALEPTRARDAALDGFLGEQAVRRARRQPLSPLADLLDPTAAAAREKAGDEGKRALEAARRAYFNDLDLDTAGALCDKAYGLFLKSDLPQHFEELVQASELKVASLAADPAKAERVRTELSLLLPIDPRGELSPNLFNPDVMKMAQGVRSQLKAASTLTLEVKTGAVPARIFVDGSFRGIAPVTVAHLAPGNHLLTAIAPGYARAQRKVNPGPEPTVELTLEPAELASAVRPRLEALPKLFLSPALPKALAELAGALKVEQVLVLAAGAGPTPSAAQVSVVRAGGTPAKPQLFADLDAPTPADELKRVAAVDGLATQAVSADHQLRGHREALASSGGSGARYAGYGLIGTGVVAGAAGAYFGLAAKSHQSDFRNLAQTDPSASSVASSGKTDALIANVAIGAAVVAVATGVALVLTHTSAAAHDEADGAGAQDEVAPRRVEPVRPAESKKPEPSKPAESKKPEPTKPAETKKPEPAKPAETKKPEPSKVESKPLEPAGGAPDGGAVPPKTPPRDLGEDIKE